jgi:hypothetical protein
MKDGFAELACISLFSYVYAQSAHPGACMEANS